jgi:hypothetical protein
MERGDHATHVPRPDKTSALSGFAYQNARDESYCCRGQAPAAAEPRRDERQQAWRCPWLRQHTASHVHQSPHKPIQPRKIDLYATASGYGCRLLVQAAAGQSRTVSGLPQQLSTTAPHVQPRTSPGLSLICALNHRRQSVCSEFVNM